MTTFTRLLPAKNTLAVKQAVSHSQTQQPRRRRDQLSCSAETDQTSFLRRLRPTEPPGKDSAPVGLPDYALGSAFPASRTGNSAPASHPLPTLQQVTGVNSLVHQTALCRELLSVMSTHLCVLYLSRKSVTQHSCVYSETPISIDSVKLLRQ